MPQYPELPSTLIGAERARLARWMSEAVELGQRCVSEEGRPRPAPKVGVVIIGRDGDRLGSSYRGAHNPGDHAEYGLLEKDLKGVDLAGATVFTTLEPCTARGPGKVPCAQHLINRGVDAVFVGMYDPFPTIYRLGWTELIDAGIRVFDFYPQHRLEVVQDNRDFTDALALTVGQSGEANFDYTLNGGSHSFRFEGVSVTTRWSQSGADSIHALDYEGHVALARGARELGQVDDPRALDWSNYTVRPNVGEVVVFRQDDTFLLVRVEKVVAGPERGEKHYELGVSYTMRTLV